MIHSIRLHILATAVLALVTFKTGAQVLATTATAPAALDRPALLSLKAASKAMLAVAQVGARLVAAGERGIVQYSDDAGGHWRQVATPTSVTLVALRFADDKHGWAIGHMGVILHTEDAGKTWVKQLDGIQAAKLVSEMATKGGNGQAIAHDSHILSEGADKPFFDLYIENARSAFVVGAFNLAFRTNDGGNTWQPWQDHIENSKALHLHAMRRAGKALLIVGEQGLLLRSMDDGEHFKQLPSPYTGTWFGLAGMLGDQLIAYGLRGNAFVSGDAGSNWKKLETGTLASISAATQMRDGRVVLASQAGELLAVSLSDGVDAIPVVTPLSGRPGLPVTDMAQAGAGDLALASLRGMVTLPMVAAKP